MKKRVLSILTSVCMALTLAAGFRTEAKAATANTSTQELTLSGLEEGVQVQAYKIIDLNVDENWSYDTPMYTWKDSVAGWLKSSNAYQTYIETDGNGVTEAYLSLKDADEQNELPDMSNQVTGFFQDMAAQLRAGNVPADKTAAAGAGGTATLSGLEMGSYLIQAEGTKNCSSIYYATVHNVLPVGTDLAGTAAAAMKHKKVTIEKEASDPSVAVGDTVAYTITTDIPAYPANVADIHYVIGDKLSEGLTFDPDSVTVKVSGADTALAAGQDYTLDTSSTDAYTFTVTMKKDTLLKNQNKKLQVTYEAVVNENAVQDPGNLVNQAYLEFNTDPFHTKDFTTLPTEEQVYTYHIDLTKVGTGGDAEGLAGAEFELMNEDKSITYKFKTADDGSYVLDETAGDTKLVSGEKGKLVIKGLDLGTYVLKETKAPTGYITPNGEITITLTDAEPDGVLDEDTAVSGADLSEVQRDQATLSFRLENRKPGDLDLPVTGGMGTLLFTLGGLAVMGGAVYLFVRSRKTSQDK